MAFALASGASASSFGANRAGPPPDNMILWKNVGVPITPLNSNAVYLDELIDTHARSIYVSFIIEAGDRNESSGTGTAFRLEIPSIQIQTQGGLIKLSDVIYWVDQAAQYDTTSPFYNKIRFYGINNASFTQATDYLETVVYYDHGTLTAWKAGQVANQNYSLGQYGLDGWQFRVNDLLPIQEITGYDPGYYEGMAIDQISIDNGDIIHLFYDLPANFSLSPTPPNPNPNYAANYVRAVYNGTVGSSRSVKLQGHKTNIDDTFHMYCYDYVDLGDGVLAGLYAADGVTLLQKGSSDINGVVTFTFLVPLPSGTYIVKTFPTYLEGSTPTNYTPIFDDVFFDLTGAYSRVVFP